MATTGPVELWQEILAKKDAEIERLRAGLRMIQTQGYDRGYTPEDYAEAVLSGHEPQNIHEQKTNPDHDKAYTHLTRKQLVDEIIRLHDENEQKTKYPSPDLSQTSLDIIAEAKARVGEQKTSKPNSVFDDARVDPADLKQHVTNFKLR